MSLSQLRRAHSAKYPPASWDYGPRTNHPHDPRNDCSASMCDACNGDGKVRADDGFMDTCEQCAGAGWLDESGAPLEIEP